LKDLPIGSSQKMAWQETADVGCQSKDHNKAGGDEESQQYLAQISITDV
jgi:hypothetical protein